MNLADVMFCIGGVLFALVLLCFFIGLVAGAGLMWVAT